MSRVFLRTCALLLVSGLAVPEARAMSVVAPTFEELVGLSDVIVRGVVTDVRAEEFDSPQGRGVHTLVTLQVERALKGSPGETVTLSLLGGKAGRRTLRVVGMPEFHVGDREIVFFARNGEVICPLIAAGHGRYHVRHDAATNRDFIARDNGTPLVSTDEIIAPLENAAAAAPAIAATHTPANALAPAAFESQIAAKVTEQALTHSRP